MSEASHKPKRQRSPSYPAIDLQEAIERARELYSREGRNTAPNEAILDHLGYSPKSGPGFGVLGALKRFGLLKSEGPGKSRLSELALRIILDDRDDSPERDKAVKEAALAPAIHQQIWEEYPHELPSDATLRYFLRSTKGFTDAAADELIRQFRNTVAFANLSPGDRLSLDVGDNDQPTTASLGVTQTAAPTRRHESSSIEGGRAVPIPLSADEWITLHGAFPLTPDAWDQLMRVLEVMKPGLVAEPTREDDE